MCILCICACTCVFESVTCIYLVLVCMYTHACVFPHQLNNNQHLIFNFFILVVKEMTFNYISSMLISWTDIEILSKLMLSIILDFDDKNNFLIKWHNLVI